MNKIVFTSTIPNSLYFFKGQFKFISELGNVTLVSSNKVKLQEIADKENVDFFEISTKREINLLKDFKSLFLYIKYFRKNKPVLVHGNTPKASLLSMLAAYVNKVPIRIYMCHGLRYQGSFGIKRKTLILMEKIATFCATNVICVSEGVKNELKKDGICRYKSLVLGYGSANGIDLNYFNPDGFKNLNKKTKDEVGIQNDDFVYIYIGRLVKDKGLSELFSSFKKILNNNIKAKLLILGCFEKNNSLPSKEITEMKKNPHVIFTGYQDDIRPFLSISNVLVLPSYREGFGLVLMEAGAMNLPVICSDIIGCNNVVLEEENGLFVKPRDAEDLYLQMKRIHNDPILYEKISQRTRESIKKRFEQSKVQKLYVDYYRRLLNLKA